MFHPVPRCRGTGLGPSTPATSTATALHLLHFSPRTICSRCSAGSLANQTTLPVAVIHYCIPVIFGTRPRSYRVHHPQYVLVLGTLPRLHFDYGLTKFTTSPHTLPLVQVSSSEFEGRSCVPTRFVARNLETTAREVEEKKWDTHCCPETSL